MTRYCSYWLALAATVGGAVGCNWEHGRSWSSTLVVVVDASAVAEVDAGRVGGVNADAAAVTADVAPPCPATCTDGNPCTDDWCDPAMGMCVHANNANPCEDGDGCTLGDACAAGKCAAGKAMMCEDGNACSDDACKGGVCVFLANAATCSDGNACTQGDACAGLGCKAGKAVNCDDGNVCTSDGCDLTMGCTATAVNEATGCDDGTACSPGDVCKGGSCVAGALAVGETVLPDKPIAAIAALPDGVVIAGTAKGTDGTASFHVQALGPAQSTKWVYADANPAEDYAWAVARLPEGTIAVAGERRPAGSTKWDGYVVVLDEGGKKVSERTMGNAAGSDDTFYAVAPAGPNAIALAGVTIVPVGGLDLWLTVVNATGAPTTAFDVHFGGPDVDGGAAVVQVGDGGFAVVGTTKSKGAGFHDFWLVRTDANGHKLWDRTYGGAVSDLAASVIAVKGGFALVGMTQSFGSGTTDDAWLIRTDDFGNVLWSKTIGGAAKDHARGIVQVAGGFVLVGYASGLDGTPNLALWRTDDLGNLQWTREIPAPGVTDTATGIAALGVGFATVGVRGTANPKDNDGWFLRTDAFGNLTCTGAGACAAKTAKDCDDGKPCTADDCGDGKGCTYKALDNGAPCADGDQCHGPDTCKDEACSGGNANTLWSATIQAPGSDVLHAAVPLPDGRIALFGSVDVDSSGPGQPDALVRAVEAWGAADKPFLKSAATSVGAADQGESFVDAVLTAKAVVAVGSTTTSAAKTDAYLARYALDGSVIGSELKFGGAGDDVLVAAVALDDGSVVAVGRSSSFGGNNDDGWIVQLGADGVLKSANGNTVGDKADSYQAFSAVGVLANGTIVAAGATDLGNKGCPRLWLHGRGPDGAVVFDRSNQGPDVNGGGVGIGARHITAVGEGFAVAVSKPKDCKTWSYDPAADTLLLRYDGVGQLMWQRNLGIKSDGDGPTDLFVNDGRLLVAGWSGSGAKRLGRVVAVDFSGNQLWERDIGSGGPHELLAIARLAGGNLAVAGFAGLGDKADAFVARLDAWGQTACGAGACSIKAAADCDDGNSCTADLCSAGSGKCEGVAKGIDAACDDDGPCWTSESCVTAACKPDTLAQWSVAVGPANVSNLAAILPEAEGWYIAGGAIGNGKVGAGAGKVGFVGLFKNDKWDAAWFAKVPNDGYESTVAKVVHIPATNGYTAALVETKGAGWWKLGRQNVNGATFYDDLKLKTGSTFGVGGAMVLLPGGGEFVAVSTNADKTASESWDWDVNWRVTKPDGNFDGNAIKHWSGATVEEFVIDACVGSDGKVAWAGTRNSKPWLVLVDPVTKKTLIDKTFALGTKASALAGIAPLAAGGYIATGHVRADPNSDDAALLLVRVAADGTPVLIKSWPSKASASDFGAAVVAEGTRVLVAGRNLSQAGPQGWNYWVLATNLAGEQLWSKVWGTAGDEGLAAITAWNGAILVAGNTAVGEGYIARLDPWGNPTCTACAGLTPFDCDDANPKTLDLCDPAKGCVHLPQ